MPIFQVSDGKLQAVEQDNFAQEKELQRLIENNLGPVFNCRFVSSEFSTGARHAGRIDTLALSEDNNPVIIEYKKVESSELITQSLFYLSWLADHRGDFVVTAQKALGGDVQVDWSDIRVICIAPNYRKYDLHAVQMMGANIELWKYRLYKNSTFLLEEVFRKVYCPYTLDSSRGGQAEEKAATLTGAYEAYSFEQHLEGKPGKIVELAQAVQEFVMNLDTAMEEHARKFYIAYRISQNIVCMEVHKQKVLLYLKLDPKVVQTPPSFSRDTSNIGHYGTGDLELSIRTLDEFLQAKSFIELAYKKIGG